MHGDEISSTSNDREKFGTYTRDSYTGLDYADQRWFTSSYGRFNTADPTTNGQGPSETAGWNRYAYAGGDPVNRIDPKGTDWITDLLYDSGYIAESDGSDQTGLGAAVYAQISAMLTAAAQQAADLAAAQAAAAAPTCSVSLYERPVDVPGTSVATGKYHTFLDEATTFANGQSVNEILDGGPTLTLAGPKLTGWDTPGTVGHYPTDNINLPATTQIGGAQSGTAICGDITKMDSEVSAYNSGSKVLYNPVPTPYAPGWNSNSFSYTLLNSVGLAFSFGSTPPSAPGWGFQVPGLTQP